MTSHGEMVQLQTNKNTQTGHRVNHRIKVPEVKVVSEAGVVGVMSTYDAIKLAKDEGLDLVEINPKSTPPICKIMDFGKFKYEEKKKQNITKKNQHVSDLKEIKLRPKTDSHDLEHKIAAALGFLKEGHKVKFTVRFRGREITLPQIAQVKLQAIAKELQATAGTISSCTLDGRTMVMMVSPK